MTESTFPKTNDVLIDAKKNILAVVDLADDEGKAQFKRIVERYGPIAMSFAAFPQGQGALTACRRRALLVHEMHDPWVKKMCDLFLLVDGPCYFAFSNSKPTTKVWLDSLEETGFVVDLLDNPLYPLVRAHTGDWPVTDQVRKAFHGLSTYDANLQALHLEKMRGRLVWDPSASGDYLTWAAEEVGATFLATDFNPHIVQGLRTRFEKRGASFRPAKAFA